MFRIVILSILVLISFIGKSQEVDYTSISELKQNQRIINNTNDYEEIIEYLGVVTDLNGEALFHVITVFTKVQASEVVHGHSRVIFLSREYQKIRQYELGLPSELPFKLIDNKLFFNYVDSLGSAQIFETKIENVPPKLLCVSPEDCY